MIHGVFGKLGSGKGLHVMEIIAAELISGFRDVVTNVPLRIEPWVNGQGIPQIGLRSYLSQRCKVESDELDSLLVRVKVMDDVDALGDLFLWRRDGDSGEWFKLEPNHFDDKNRPDRFDPAVCRTRHCAPCLVVTDEAWICYPNNGGWSRSPLIPFYARQQRKLRDEWYIITQHPTDVDSVIWNITQDFTVCRNHGMERMGLFRQPAMFRTITYLTNPAKGSAIRSHENYKRLDAKGLAQCYDTTAGVGFAGGFAGDANQKRAGLHVGWLILAVALLVAALMAVPHILGKGASAWIGKAAGKPKNASHWAGMTNSATAISSPVNRVADLPPVSVMSLPAPMSNPESNEVVCVGVSHLGGVWTVFLSDGRRADSEDGDLQEVRAKSVKAFGKEFIRVKSPRLMPAGQVEYLPAGVGPVAAGAVNAYPGAAVVEDNGAVILPVIHAQGGTPPPRLNGIGEMNRHLSQGRQND